MFGGGNGAPDPSLTCATGCSLDAALLTSEQRKSLKEARGEVGAAAASMRW